MSPSRELAIQTLKVVKEMAKGTDLRIVLLMGGDSLEDQFGSVIMHNPDMLSPSLSLAHRQCDRYAGQIPTFSCGNVFRFGISTVYRV
jgi:DEAD/DEAH box helicase